VTTAEKDYSQLAIQRQTLQGCFNWGTTANS